MHAAQGCDNGGGRGGGGTLPILSNLQESWLKVSHAAREHGHSIFHDLFF